ncbi:MAG: hypothetical protein O4859_11665 [Trichodesmium sp. St18_bin1]|nr:hypothetical protein [Trichodesmium sp. St18_bin1]MDE5121134.1 hypothetical protein [Trichodesmium sp. St19_bin1]
MASRDDFGVSLAIAPISTLILVFWLLIFTEVFTLVDHSRDVA